MQARLEHRDAEPFALAREHQHVGERVQVDDLVVVDADAHPGEELHPFDLRGARLELLQIRAIAVVVRAGDPGDHEHRFAAPLTEGRGRVDRRLDALAASETHR